jgi:2-polyprenyl-3-methyl-5-hydroxy-6-metoxy-1,4-benzoquinol methylase
MTKIVVVEKKLGISPDYQYKQLRGKNFLFANWHNNKLVVMDYILKLTKARDILDLGTGSGNFELKFAKRLNKIVGVDYNDEAIGFLKSKLRENKINNVKLIVRDVREIKKIKNLPKFDLIIMVDVIEHLKIKDAEKLVIKLKSMLKKGGEVCIITPNYKSTWLILERMLDIFTILPHFEGEQHLAKYYKQNIENLFTRVGFKPVYFSSFNLFSFVFFNKSIAKTLCKLEMALKLPFGNLIVCLFKLR